MLEVDENYDHEEDFSKPLARILTGLPISLAFSATLVGLLFFYEVWPGPGKTIAWFSVTASLWGGVLFYAGMDVWRRYRQYQEILRDGTGRKEPPRLESHRTDDGDIRLEIPEPSENHISGYMIATGIIRQRLASVFMEEQRADLLDILNDQVLLSMHFAGHRASDIAEQSGVPQEYVDALILGVLATEVADASGTGD